MSIQLGKLVSQILHQYFGEFVQTVGADLYRYGSKPMYLILKTTRLPKATIVECLRALIKYGLVTFTPAANEVSADYKLSYENVLLLLRYPRFLLQIKNKYGSEAEMIIEEILHEGTISASILLVNIFNKYKDDREKNISLVTLRDTLTSLVTAGYVQRAPFLLSADTNADVPTLTNVPPNQNTLPSVDIAIINQAIEANDSSTIQDEIYWKVNFDRFHQDFRDEIMIKAMSRRIDDNAGELMKHLLIQMYLRTDPWVPTSNPIPVVEIRESCKRANAEFPLLTQYLDQYLKVMEENSMGFVVRSGDAGGGQYSLNLRTASEQLLWSIVEHTIQEKLGSKAARIFRLIRAKKYIEEEDIQKNAMLPAKEAKQLTYKLMEEHFINLQPMRKAASSASGPSKAIYLYYIDLHQVAHMVSELTYVALYNCICRKDHERLTNRRIIDKQQRVETIVHGMRMRGEPDDNIKDIEDTVTPPERNVLQRIQGMIKKLSTAEIQLDRTLFILQLYFIYNNKV